MNKEIEVISVKIPRIAKVDPDSPLIADKYIFPIFVYLVLTDGELDKEELYDFLKVKYDSRHRYSFMEEKIQTTAKYMTSIGIKTYKSGKYKYKVENMKFKNTKPGESLFVTMSKSAILKIQNSSTSLDEFNRLLLTYLYVLQHIDYSGKYHNYSFSTKKYIGSCITNPTWITRAFDANPSSWYHGWRDHFEQIGVCNIEQVELHYKTKVGLVTSSEKPFLVITPNPQYLFSKEENNVSE